MRKVIFALTVFLLAAALVQSGNIKHLGGVVGIPAGDSIDSTMVKDGGASGADLADTLRHTGRIYTTVLDADTLFTSGLVSQGGGSIYINDSGNYIDIADGFIRTYGRMRIVSTPNYYLYFTLDGASFTAIGMVASGRDLITGNPDADSLNIAVNAVNDLIFATDNGTEFGRGTKAGTFKLNVNASFPDTTGFVGGEMWLSATGDSMYIYLSSHTMQAISFAHDD